MTWTSAQRRVSRAEYARLYATGHRHKAAHVDVPADVTVMERDPFPCGYCASRDGCKHRPWLLRA